MTPLAVLILGIIQLALAPVLLLARQPIADWLADNVPPLDVAWWHVRGPAFIGYFGATGATVSGAMFTAFGAWVLVNGIAVAP